MQFLAQGFTMDTITLLALALAVGIAIDDAIVVLENIVRFVDEKGMKPLQAAIEATREIGLAVLATTLSLLAVFVPVAFMSGIVGRFLKSFGLTMAFAIAVSLFVSFTLTPMPSSRWLRTRRAFSRTSRKPLLERLVDRLYLPHRGRGGGRAGAVVVAHAAGHAGCLVNLRRYSPLGRAGESASDEEVRANTRIR